MVLSSYELKKCNQEISESFCCSRLALRNHSGATQKTTIIADVSLVRINQLHQSTTLSSDSKTPSTPDSKKKKNDPRIEAWANCYLIVKAVKTMMK